MVVTALQDFEFPLKALGVGWWWEGERGYSHRAVLMLVFVFCTVYHRGIMGDGCTVVVHGNVLFCFVLLVWYSMVVRCGSGSPWSWQSGKWKSETGIGSMLHAAGL